MGSKTTAKKAKAGIFYRIFGGDFLVSPIVVKNLPLIVLIFILLIFSLAKGYYSKQMQKDIIEKQADLDAKTAEFIEVKAEMEERTARFRLTHKLEKYGLREATDPVKVIRIKSEK